MASEHNKKQKTFVIEILDTQNRTWQGTIESVNIPEKRPFRSALEMLKFMNETIENDDEAKDRREF